MTPKARLRIAKLIVEDGWRVSTAAKLFMVSWPTAKRWADRYQAHGKDGMDDKPSRPRAIPNRAPQTMVKKIVALRWRKRMGPVQIAFRLGLTASSVHAFLVRCRINQLRYSDRVTGEKIRHYEHPQTGSMIHVDVTRFGNVHDGGGHRFVGRQAGDKNRAGTPGKSRSSHHNPKMGTAFMHTVIDDHSRIAYAEIHDDEKSVTAIRVLHRAVAWFAARKVTVERVLSDNGSAYR